MRILVATLLRILEKTSPIVEPRPFGLVFSMISAFFISILRLKVYYILTGSLILNWNEDGKPQMMKKIRNMKALFVLLFFIGDLLLTIYNVS